VWAVTTFSGVQYYDGGPTATVNTAGTTVGVKVYPNQTTTLPAAIVAPEAFAADDYGGSFDELANTLEDNDDIATWSFYTLANVTTNRTQVWSRMVSASGTSDVNLNVGWLTALNAPGTQGSVHSYTTTAGGTLNTSSGFNAQGAEPAAGGSDVVTKADVRAASQDAEGSEGSPQPDVTVAQADVWIVQAAGTDPISHTVITP